MVVRVRIKNGFWRERLHFMKPNLSSRAKAVSSVTLGIDTKTGAVGRARHQPVVLKSNAPAVSVAVGEKKCRVKNSFINFLKVELQISISKNEYADCRVV